MKQALRKFEVTPIVSHRVIARRIVKVTPELAAKILEKNMNRRVQQSRVDKWARAMKRGEWTLNGASIKFAEDGTLIDGQHRLYAVLMTGLTIEFEFAEGLPLAVASTIDTGASRTMSDVLTLSGIGYATVLAATLRWFWLHERGLIPSPVSVTHTELLDLLEKKPELHERLPEAGKYSTVRSIMTPGLWGFIYSMTMSIDEDKAAEFAEQLETGAGLVVGAPALALRDRLLARKRGEVSRQARTERKRLNQPFIAAISIKAWNAFYLGRTVRALKWIPSEDFPSFAGQ